MRIGKFAENYNITINTVRHYMDMGLIIPEMQGSQYYFDDRCQSDLEEVINLKDMEFALNEIKAILLFRRFGNLTAYEQSQYYQTFFENKLLSVEQKMERLKEVRKNLKFEIQKLYNWNEGKNNKIGIDLNNLKLFKCLILS